MKLGIALTACLVLCASPADAVAAPLPLGALSPIGCVTGAASGSCTVAPGIGRGFSGVASPNGSSVYVVHDTSGGAAGLVVLARATNGALAPNECFEETGGSHCGAGHTVPGLEFTTDVAASPDGKNVYVTSEGSAADEGLLEIFDVNADGSLTPASCYEYTGGTVPCGTGHAIAGIGDPSSVAVSPDGKNVYVAAYDSRAIVTFNRAADGSLAPAGCVQDPGGGNVDAPGLQCGTSTTPGMQGANSVAISPDGANVYVAGFTSGAIVAFNRAANGALTPAGCIQEVGQTDCGAATGHGLEEASSVAVSPDGRNVYTHSADTGGPLAIFDRSASGALTAVTCIAGQTSTECPTKAPANSGNIVTARTITVAPDGKDVYVSSNLGAVLWFARAADGTLTFIGCDESSGSDCTAAAVPTLSAANGVFTSPGGESVYVVSNDGISEFERGVAPICAPTAAGTAYGTPVTVTLACVDRNGDPVTITAAAPSHGTLGPVDQSTGRATYSPAAGFGGTDTISFSASDGVNVSAPATATIAVGPQPAVTRLRVTPKTFAARGAGATIARHRRRAHAGATISFTLNLDDRVSFSISRATPGRRPKHTCVKATRHNRHAHRCTRFAAAGRFAEALQPGAVKLTFSGRIKGHKLPPGRYRLTATPTGGQAKTAWFTIVRG